MLWWKMTAPAQRLSSKKTPNLPRAWSRRPGSTGSFLIGFMLGTRPCIWLRLDTGADPRSAMNMRRSQPLHYAADGHLNRSSWDPKRQVSMIRLLLESGADIQAQDKNGATPLHRAVRTRCAAAVGFLLDAGANPKMKNLPGSTPFHLAVQNTGRGGSGADKAKTAQREIICAFLKRGVSTRLKDARGKTVSDWTRGEWIRDLLKRRQ
jgi:hypothetical protein